MGPKRIFISNRLPFNVNKKTGALSRGSGGLVSALLGVNLDEPFMWMGFETNQETAQILETRSSEIKSNLICKPVLINPQTYDTYYDGVANDLIWPLFHYETNHAIFERYKWQVYRAVNQSMADKILEEAKDGDSIWIHDFHFLLLPKMLKEKNPNLKVGFFLHIPFPGQEVFRQLPVKEEILDSLSYCDLLGFHEHSYLRNFNDCLKSYLGLESTLFTAKKGNHTMHMGVFPISIDTVAFRKKAASIKVHELCESYRAASSSQFKIIGIDRLDYTKGLELKLKGFQQALRKYPELVGKVSLLQVAVPTRQKVPCYMQIKKEIDQLVGAINGEFATPDYTPVHYIYNSISEETLLALYKRADAALVTSKRDGMNLVAMEYVIAQDVQTAGVLILSEFAGAASLLSDALMINPWDADLIADAILKAFEMPAQEKRSRMANLQQTLSRYSATQWAENFLTELDSCKPVKPMTDSFPLSPQIHQWPSSFISSLENKKVRLLLDYDGTLVSLQSRPDLALLLEDMRHMLDQLRQEVEIIVVSGRPKEFLDSQFAEHDFILAAEHGAYFKYPGQAWQSRISSDVNSWYPEVEKVMQSYTARVPFSFVEKKTASLVWHYRQSPEEFADVQGKRLETELKSGLANQAVTVMLGSKIVEAKAMECNKGTFVRWLKQNDKENHCYICLGDDKTDEDMFQALNSEDLTLKIGTEKTAAKYHLESQKQVLPFLYELHIFLNELKHHKQRGAHA